MAPPRLTKLELAIMEALMEQFKAQVRDISAAPPVVEEYETLVHFGDLARST